MTEEEERQWWLKMVKELREVLTIARFAAEIGVTERTVCNWQAGERPLGMKAIRVYLLHLKLVERPTRSTGNIETEFTGSAIHCKPASSA